VLNDGNHPLGPRPFKKKFNLTAKGEQT
jgi:hypothetical protein